MTWLISLITSLFSLWRKTQNDQTLDQGINYQKAKETGDALRNAADSKVIGADVDRMSDDQLRNSPYANQRD